MNRLIKFKTVINKRNGQINISLKKKELPKEIRDSLKKQPGSLKHILAEIKGFDSEW